MKMNALDLRKGNLVSYEGRTCEVIYWNILKNDRRQFVQMKVKDLLTGRISEVREHGDEKWEVLNNSVVDFAHSYRDGNDEVFYSADGEEYRCPVAAAEAALVWEADSYRGLIVEGQLVVVTPPRSVVAVVKETAPPMKGGGSGLKDAMLENGIKVRVSLLTAVGDRVRIDPETMEFKERVTS
jgi:translation elongation factor P/translation initiation factor 5A